MILDRVSNGDTYSALGEGFAKAVRFLQRKDIADLPAGNYAVDGDRVYVMIQEADLKDWDEGAWESHFRYADIQMPLTGRETISCGPTEGARVTVPCPEGGDVQFLDCPLGRRFTLEKGEMMILSPQDAHKPCIAPSEGERHIRKAVAKVLLK